MSLATPPAPGAVPPPPRPACSFSLLEVPLNRLKSGGLHEIKPHAYRDHPAALGFALAALAQAASARTSHQDLVLWCLTKQTAREWGRPYGPGVKASGLDPALFLIVEARNPDAAAWALEEGLKSGTLIAALAAVEIKTELAARRLGLVAQASRTPCLILSDHGQPNLPGSLTSWRVAAGESAPALFDASAPGRASWQITLERCRGEAPGRSFIVEFSHESFRFDLPAAARARAAEAGESRIGRRAARR